MGIAGLQVEDPGPCPLQHAAPRPVVEGFGALVATAIRVQGLGFWV